MESRLSSNNRSLMRPWLIIILTSVMMMQSLALADPDTDSTFSEAEAQLNAEIDREVQRRVDDADLKMPADKDIRAALLAFKIEVRAQVEQNHRIVRQVIEEQRGQDFDFAKEIERLKQIAKRISELKPLVGKRNQTGTVVTYRNEEQLPPETELQQHLEQIRKSVIGLELYERTHPIPPEVEQKLALDLGYARQGRKVRAIAASGVITLVTALAITYGSIFHAHELAQWPSILTNQKLYEVIGGLAPLLLGWTAYEHQRNVARILDSKKLVEKYKGDALLTEWILLVLKRELPRPEFRSLQRFLKSANCRIPSQPKRYRVAPPAETPPQVRIAPERETHPVPAHHDEPAPPTGAKRYLDE